MGCATPRAQSPHHNPEDDFGSTYGETEDELSRLDRPIVHPNIECPSNFKVKRICANKKCSQKNSFYCESESCGSCRVHDSCTSYSIEYITDRVNHKTAYLRGYIKELLNLENMLIQEMRETRKTLINKYRWEIMKGRDQELIDSLFKEKYIHIKALSPETANLYEHLEELDDETTKDKIKKRDLINDFKKEIEETAFKLNHSLENLIRIYLNRRPLPEKNIKEKRGKGREAYVAEEQESEKKEKEKVEEEEKPVELKKREPKIEARISLSNDEKRAELREEEKKAIEDEKIIDAVSRTINSKIIGDNIDTKKFIVKMLNKPKKLQLLFRASENTFSAHQFHKRCDKVSDTITVIRNEFGKTFGGYTPCEWGSPHPPAFQKDPDRKSFLFSIDMKEKMTLNEPERAIRCDPSWGPIFGGGQGSDIAISDRCFSNKESYMGFPWSYNTEGKYKRRPETYASFCGAKEGYWFKVLDYEVYKVEW